MRKPIFADISLLFVTFIWGTTFVLVQNAISLLDPFSFNGIRFLAAAVMLLLWLFLFERKQIALLNLKMLASGLFIGFWLFLGYATQTIGLLYTTTSKAGFITGLSVIFVPLFSMFLLKQFPSRNAVIGVSIATVGLFLLTMTDVSSLNIGDGLVFICAISFALQIIFTGKFSNKHPTLLLTVIQISTVAVLSILSAFIFEDWRKSFNVEILLSKDVIVALMITSVLATALAFLIQTNFQKYTTATRVALIFAMEPVFAAIAGYYWADERLSVSALFGCLLIFAGMIFAELPANKFPLLRKNKSVQG
ncbi:drug/metabolite transporter (DMT)-like permease [Bacillus niacini]|uniref:Drug/metabolite transporter (DMT)-like permease n=1 Tax=Neobacillus niacini TaxID=86668 RepID=A0A852T7H0_9BACI|nr:DMT family transporter [Neobacillus niacini]NYE04720.1 drug/metabolite transporter (DMT)-like permease [Neobacillus niacini]